jgi:uncharacterized membrane protein
MAATLSVWEFDTSAGADEAHVKVDRLHAEEVFTVSDGAIVSWEPGTRKPRTAPFPSADPEGALGGSFWGFLFGVMFFVPLIGMTLGAATGIIAGALTDVGIDDNFIRRIRRDIRPGTSALFVLTSSTEVDRLTEAFRGANARLLQADLSDKQEAAIRTAFAD